MSTSASVEFVKLLARCSSGLSDEQVRFLQRHFELLERWNQVINLTALRELSEVVERHYGESLFLAAHLPAGDLNVADIGSGAGFPGVPVAVSRPDCRVTLIESHQRKAVFLRESTRGLPNVRVLACRAEKVRESFDWVISRGVRFSDIAATARRLAYRAAILTSETDPGGGFCWEPPLPLPWNPQHYLLLGADVSRETSG